MKDSAQALSQQLHRRLILTLEPFYLCKQTTVVTGKLTAMIGMDQHFIFRFSMLQCHH